MSSVIPTYSVGDRPYIEGRWTDAAGELTDPDEVFVRIAAPDGTDETFQNGVDPGWIRLDDGHYRYSFDLNQPGMWRYKIYSTGNGQAAATGAIRAAKTIFDR